MTSELTEKARHYTPNSKKSKDGERMIREILHDYLRDKHSKPNHLGDRKGYIGSSDHCERAAYQKRMYPKEYCLETLMQFERGKQFEDLMAAALSAKGIDFVREAELTHPSRPWVKVHIDFLFEREDSSSVTIGIMECKDVDGIPAAPYETWKEQVLKQQGVAMLHFKKAEKPVIVRAILVAKDAASCEIGIFNDIGFDATKFETLMEGADRIWAVLNNNATQEILKTKPDILCAYCDYRFDCPTFFKGDKLDLSPIAGEIQAYLAEQAAEKEAVDRKKRSKNKITQFMGLLKKGTCGVGHVKMVHVQSVKTTDFQGLEEFLKEFSPEILGNFQREKPGYSYPRITPLLQN